MPPPTTTQDLIHRQAAALYADNQVSTTTSLNQLIKTIDASIGPGARPASVVDADVAKFAKALSRAYRGRGRLRRLWEGVLERAERDPADAKSVSMPPAALRNLKAELAAGDPALAPVLAALDLARNSSDPVERWLAVQDADLALQSLPLPESDGADSSDVVLADKRARAERIASAWTRVFELAVGDSGSIPDERMALCERAIAGGAAAQAAALKFRRRSAFGSRSFAPQQVRMHVGRRGRWIAAAAVLLVLRGVDLKDLVDRTRSWAVKHLDVPASEVSDVEVLTQAGWTLLHAGRRALASEAVHAGWTAAGRSHSQIPDELLELSIELAGVHFAHGEHDAAQAALAADLQVVLAGAPPGDPDDGGWGEVVSFIFYRHLLTALSDPPVAVGALRRLWLESLRPGFSTAYPSKWILAGVLVQLLSDCGDARSAATVARKSLLVLESPSTASEQQLRSHMSEMFDGSGPAVSAEVHERIGALLAELVPLVVSQPTSVDYSRRALLEGLLQLADDRILSRPLRHVDG